MPSVKTNVRSRKRSKRSRGRKRRLFAILTLVVIVVAIVSIVRGALVRGPKLPQSAAPTPVAAKTPVPVPWSPQDLARVRAMLSRTFAPAIGASDRASLVVLAADGQTLYSYGEHNTVTPASVQKLVVAYAALNLLGPNYRYRTMLAGLHPITSEGTLESDLWLIGSGDPSFRRDDLRAGVAELHKEGLRSLAGTVSIDSSAIAGPEINPHWSAADAGEDFQAPVSGVSLDGDTVEFRVYGTSAGQPARVVMLPRNTDVSMYGAVMTSSGSDSVIIAPLSNNTFRFSGTIPAGIEEKFWLPVHDIPRYVGNVLETMLVESGIHVRGAYAYGPAPLDAISLWEHRSQALPVLLKHMLYFSDNHYAEQLLRTIGADAGGAADDAAGIAAERQFLRSRAIPLEGMRLFDGSGLAEANRISALTLARILSDAELRGGGAELYPLLPAGGREGTLKYYDFQTARVRAKTGHLSDADSLAGYVDTAHHGRLAFAFSIDNSVGDPDAAYVNALDRLSGY